MIPRKYVVKAEDDNSFTENDFLNVFEEWVDDPFRRKRVTSPATSIDDDTSESFTQRNAPANFWSEIHYLDSSLKGFPIDPRVVQLDSDVGQALEHHAAV